MALSSGVGHSKPLKIGAPVTASADGSAADGQKIDSPVTGMVGARLKGARIVSRIEGGKLVITGLSATLGGGQVRADGRISMADAGTPQRARAQFAEVGIRDAMRGLGFVEESENIPAVKASGAVDAQWRGTDTAGLSRSLTGSAVVLLGPGQIDAGSPMFAKLAEMAGGNAIQRLEFTYGRVEAVARDGYLRITSGTLVGPEFALNISGDVNVRDSLINLVCDVKVSNQLADQTSFGTVRSLGSLFSRDSATKTTNEFVALPLVNIEGALTRPNVRLQMRSRTMAQTGAATEAGWTDSLQTILKTAATAQETGIDRQLAAIPNPAPIQPATQPE